MHLIDICSVPVYIDTVSTAHSSKIKGCLGGIDTIKPNKLEAEYLTDITISDDNGYVKAAQSFLDQGVKRIFISAGSEGIIAAGKEGIYKVSSYPSEIVSTTGAGDSAMAAIAWASLDKNNSLTDIAKAANAVASMTLAVNETNNPDLSRESALKKIKSADIEVIRLK